MNAPGCPEEFPCPVGHCRGNPDCPNSRITAERYPELFAVLQDRRSRGAMTRDTAHKIIAQVLREAPDRDDDFALTIAIVDALAGAEPRLFRERAWDTEGYDIRHGYKAAGA